MPKKRSSVEPRPTEAPSTSPSERLKRTASSTKQHAIASTKLKHYPAAVAEWLHDFTPGKQAIRGQFEHNLSNASDATLTKAKAIIAGIADALDRNDPSALAVIDSIYEEHFGFLHEYELIQRAKSLVEGASEAYQSARDDEERAYHAASLLVMLGTIDERFRQVDVALSAAQLAKVRMGGGKGKTGPVDALAQLCLASGAFFEGKPPSKEVLKKKLKKALEHRPKPKTAR